MNQYIIILKLNYMKIKNRFFEKVKNVKSKIKLYFNSIWFKYVEEPKLIREKYRQDKKIVDDFESKQKLKVDRVKDLMVYKQNYHSPKKEYYDEKLTEARKYYHDNFDMNSWYIKPPAFYEPDICDIHNDSLEKSDPNALKKLIYDEARKLPFKSISHKKTLNK